MCGRHSPNWVCVDKPTITLWLGAEEQDVALPLCRRINEQWRNDWGSSKILISIDRKSIYLCVWIIKFEPKWSRRISTALSMTPAQYKLIKSNASNFYLPLSIFKGKRPRTREVNLDAIILSQVIPSIESIPLNWTRNWQLHCVSCTN